MLIAEHTSDYREQGMRVVPSEMGLRQGCAVYPWVRNVYMNGVVRVTNASVFGRGFELLGLKGRRWQLSQFLFGDNTAR